MQLLQNIYLDPRGGLKRGLGILLAESRKSLKKVTENRRREKGPAENQKKLLCRKAEMQFLSHGNLENWKMWRKPENKI